MTPRTTFEPKLAAAVVQVTFPFTLPVGVTISSATVAASVYSGVDASPSSILSGSPTILGANVMQLLAGGVVGVTYQLLGTAVLSDGQHLQVSGYLSIVPALI